MHEEEKVYFMAIIIQCMFAYVCIVNYKNHTLSPREGYLTLAFGPWAGNLT